MPTSLEQYHKFDYSGHDYTISGRILAPESHALFLWIKITIDNTYTCSVLVSYLQSVYICMYIYIYMYQQGILTQHTCDKTASFISGSLLVPFWDV